MRTLAENGGLKQQKHGGFHSVFWVSSTNGDLCVLMKNNYIYLQLFKISMEKHHFNG